MYLNDIIQCLADGRDNTGCCEKTAADPDESACFDMCKGEVNNLLPWPKIQACLTINIQRMFKCYEDGHDRSPSPPRNINIIERKEKEIKVQWNAPSVNGRTVGKYLVTVFNVDAKQIAFFRETRQEEISITGLIPNAVYEVRIVAIGKTHNHKSQALISQQFTNSGTAPKVIPYNDDVYIQLKADSIVLACRTQNVTNNLEHVQVEWRKKNKRTKNFDVIHDKRYTVNIHKSKERNYEFTTILTIKDITPYDFGIFRCSASNEYGSSSSELRLSEAPAMVYSTSPPETIVECCQSMGVAKRCLPLCGQKEYISDTTINSGPQLPINCTSEISKVTECAMVGVTDASCCLAANIPDVCMYLCDERRKSLNYMPIVCYDYLESITVCRVTADIKKPSQISKLKVISSTKDTTNLRWNIASLADSYLIYWRKSPRREWQMKSTSSLGTKIAGADEIVVMGVNNFGYSAPRRLTLQVNEWV
uniref:Ig-like and fibronectin type-III domain-containing protein C25G4.10 n=1 Tax=Rhabditophanes sp. KR3021 TaxID=114890 RepID=A0AC35U6L6_9BILA